MEGGRGQARSYKSAERLPPLPTRHASQPSITAHGRRLTHHHHPLPPPPEPESLFRLIPGSAPIPGAPLPPRAPRNPLTGRYSAKGSDAELRIPSAAKKISSVCRITGASAENTNSLSALHGPPPPEDLAPGRLFLSGSFNRTDRCPRRPPAPRDRTPSSPPLPNTAVHVSIDARDCRRYTFRSLIQSYRG